MELNIDVIETAEEQKKKFKQSFTDKLKASNLIDPNSLLMENRKDLVAEGPSITIGSIFSFILKTKYFDSEYISKYKVQKAFSFFDCGFVSSIWYFRFKKMFVCIFQSVWLAKINEKRKRWIPFSNNGIISDWCLCMAGAFKACNHVITPFIKWSMLITKVGLIQHAPNKCVSGINILEKILMFNH